MHVTSFGMREIILSEDQTTHQYLISSELYGETFEVLHIGLIFSTFISRMSIVRTVLSDSEYNQKFFQ